MDEFTSKLCQLLHDYGENWQIERRGLVWAAVQRPEPQVLILHCAFSLDELRHKIEKDS